MTTRFLMVFLFLMVVNGCVGTMKIADTPSNSSKSPTMQSKVDNNSSKK